METVLSVDPVSQIKYPSICDKTDDINLSNIFSSFFTILINITFGSIII